MPKTTSCVYNGVRLRLRGYGGDTVHRLLLDYEDGEQPAALSKRYGIPVSTIENWTTKTGIVRSRKEARLQRTLNEGKATRTALARIAAGYYFDEQLPLQQTAEKVSARVGYRVSTGWVRDVLVGAGYTLRSRAESRLISRYGSLEAYHAHRRRLCYEIEVLGRSRTAVGKEYGHSFRYIADVLESEDNLYRYANVDPPPEMWDLLPYHTRMVLEMEASGLSHMEAIERALLAWTIPPPAVSFKPFRRPFLLPRSA